MTTKITTVTLMAVITAENLDDSLVPSAIRLDTIATISNAPQSRLTDPSLTVPRANPNTSPRQLHQPLGTTPAPPASSSSRFQPMIQARNSPKVAYEKV